MTGLKALYMKVSRPGVLLSRSRLIGIVGPGPIPAYKMALAGSIAGGVAGVIGNPAELMMVRMQADKAKPIDSEQNLDRVERA